MKPALIISDGKPGHFNQSIACCKHLGLDYEITDVAYKSRPAKALSYLLDQLGIYSENILKLTADSSQHAAKITYTGCLFPARCLLDSDS